MVLACTALLLALASCAGPGTTDGQGSTLAPTPSPIVPSPTLEVLAGNFEAEEGRTLAIACWGEGSPTVIYDAGTGTSGIQALAPAVKALADTTRVCTYDRAGVGSSDPAPERARTVDDLADDLHQLLEAAGVAGPYVLVGSSGGGFDSYHYAGRYPDDVVGLVMDDVPAPQADIPSSEVPAWDSSENPEHMDYVLFEHELAVDRLPIPSIPVTVLWATNGQSAAQADQDLWLEGSSAPVSAAVQSGHDIMHGNPAAVAGAIADMLELLRG